MRDLNRSFASLSSFVPSEVCLACDGCCRFAERDSVWAPLFLFEEILSLTRKNIVPTCLFTHPAQEKGTAARINLIKEKGQLFCPCLSLADNACKIYEQRPFDCRLYPFLLMREGGKAYLALDKRCPYVSKKSGSRELKDHTAALVLYFKTPEASRTLKENPRMIQAYPVSGDLEILEPIDF